MKVQDTIYLKKPSLVLIPENSYEIVRLKRCLGSRSPLRVMGSLAKYDTDYPEGSVVLWDDSQNRSECLPDQDEPGPETRVVKKKADLSEFMHALRRFINVIIDYRQYPGQSDNLANKIHEASQDLQKTIKPLFEEEVH